MPVQKFVLIHRVDVEIFQRKFENSDLLVSLKESVIGIHPLGTMDFCVHSNSW